MHEPVRLVVWDLDETFWKGTLTEGGIKAYVQEHHDIVIELARRGIMSSICSKNDFDTVMQILKEKDLLDYIVFPSISWEPKGARLAALVDNMQFRPATVMFIDDNPNTRAEAASSVPGLQVQDENFIPNLLSDPRFVGKPDPGLTRLAQYKLLETKKADQSANTGSNESFLRSCDIRVYIEYDIETNIDRAIELINRTNQLNFTKQRVPENVANARVVLREQCRKASVQAGLIKVVDKYGDYGFVGFYLMKMGRHEPSPELASSTLIHFCFSCRTLGMLVEKWIYDWLRKPEITVVGEVLTDLSKTLSIDWIRVVPTLSSCISQFETIAPTIRVYGGCEAHAVGHYLSPYAGSVRVTGNSPAGRLFIRLNSGALLLSACEHAGIELEREVKAFGIPYKLLGTDYFLDAPYGTVFVFSGAYDAEYGQYRYRHKICGWDLKIEINGLAMNFISASDEQIRELETRGFAPEAKAQVMDTVRRIRDNYNLVQGVSGPDLTAMMRRLLDRIPTGSRFIILIDDERFRAADGTVQPAPWTSKYNAAMRDFAAEYEFVGLISLGDYISSETQIQVGGNHYDRMVYQRAAMEIVSVAATLPGKPAGEAWAAQLRDGSPDEVTASIPPVLNLDRSSGKSSGLRARRVGRRTAGE